MVQNHPEKVAQGNTEYQLLNAQYGRGNPYKLFGMSDIEDARRALDVARGKRVRAIREEAGWDQPTFVAKLNARAEQLGIPERHYPSTISRTEGGKRGLSLDDAILIASVDPKGRTIDWIAFGNEPASAQPYRRVAERLNVPIEEGKGAREAVAPKKTARKRGA